MIKKAFKCAFPYTVPILTGFLFLGISYGIYMRALGFSAAYPIFMSMLIFAGSMEFVTATMLLSSFNPVGAALLTLMVNARHIFYGITMVSKYKQVGRKKWYLIFGMCDESFSINCSVDVPEGVDKGWFYFWVTLLNQSYWVLGATSGALIGSLLTFDTKGLEFVMTALFVVIFLDNWLKEKNYISSLLGLAASLACLVLFGADKFLVPSMCVIFLILSLARPALKKEVA
ncbi:MAG: branched-chain amino acid transporter AzlC [Lachnospiraceae bacterium]|nr:branched-chain amino acid transporter AzlC [Lachnospiraceae bacterium]